jgi:hypothetical protein
MLLIVVMTEKQGPGIHITAAKTLMMSADLGGLVTFLMPGQIYSG